MQRSLTTRLKLWFSKSFAQLPEDLQRQVEPRFVPRWDALTSAERRIVAQQLDAQHPTNEVEKLAAESDFKEGYQKVSIPRRNKRNAQRPRPRNQLVSDDDIVRVKHELEIEGVPPHKQCAEAYRRCAPPITNRAFRKRWRRLTGIKGT